MANENPEGQVPSPGDVPPPAPPPAAPPAAESQVPPPAAPPPAVPPPAVPPPAVPQAPPVAAAPPPAPPVAAAPPQAPPVPPSPVQPVAAPPVMPQAPGQPVVQGTMAHPSGVAPQAAVAEAIPQSVINPHPGVAPQPVGPTPGAASAVPPGMGPITPNAPDSQEVPTPGGFLQGPRAGSQTQLAEAVGPDGQRLGPVAVMAPTAYHPAPGLPVPAQAAPHGALAPVDPNQRTIWIFVNRNNFPVHLPHPDDPGSSVTFPPCSDRSRHLGMLDFKTHPFFGNFVGFKRSISQEPSPAYLQLRPEYVEATGTQGQSVHDLMRMSPERVAEYVRFVSQTNPEIAQQIANALGATVPNPAGRITSPVQPISQAPPGM